MKGKIGKFIVIIIIFTVLIVAMPPAILTFVIDGYFTQMLSNGIAPVHEPELTPSPTPEPTPQPRPAPTPTPLQTPEPTPTPTPQPTPEPTPEPPVTITVSAAGDVVFGGDPARPSAVHFRNVFSYNDYDMTYFFRNVLHIFEDDDLTIVNYEGTFTYETQHRGREFNFRASPTFAQALVYGSIEAVSLANNHSGDFLARGYQDTKDALDAVGVAYFGNATNTILEINGINVGLFGYLAWHDTAEMRANVTSSIEYLLENGAQLIIAFFHWGREKSYGLHPSQQPLGRFTIDSGAHLVLGAHPHVVQGIEIYNGRNIVYSLANFSFGGNRHPFDMDSFIFRQTFTFIDGVLQDTNDSEIIPIRTTSTPAYNNLQPTPAEGEDYARIRNLLRSLSNEINPPEYYDDGYNVARATTRPRPRMDITLMLVE